MAVPCPKCGRDVEQSGEATMNLDGEATTYTVYQCEHCTMPIDLGGDMMEGAYTFAIGPDGKPFDPFGSP